MKKLSAIVFIFLALGGFCQDSSSTRRSLNYSGYIKDLFVARSDKNFQPVYATNLIHNRFNVKWNPPGKISGRLDIRNRLYWGDDVRTIPGFKEQLKNQNDAIDLSTTWSDNRSIFFHSNIERLWMEYRKSKWNIRAGRQRINWGIANTWNPNDLFNTYDFLNFDYEERPGTDAVRIQYHVNDLSNFEFAFAGTERHTISAVKYSTNYRKYDFQAIAGTYQNIFTAGIGWAGSISDLGFKGEAQYYAYRKDSASCFTGTIEADYIFKTGWYLSSAILYNQKGWHAPPGKESIFILEASPRNLMPARWNLLLSSSKEFTLLVSGSMNVVYSPQVNLLIIYPSLRYNLKPNLDFDFVWQSFFIEMQQFEAISHMGFLRLKWSF